MVNNFLITQLFKSLIFSARRVFIIVLAIFISALVSSAFLNIYFDLDTKLSKELKAYGANLNILPTKTNELISNHALEKLKGELGAKNLTPYLYAFLSVDGSHTLVLGTDFSSLKLTKPFLQAVEGSFSLSDFDENSAFIGKDLATKLISANKQDSLQGLIGREFEIYGLLGEKAILKIKGIVSNNDEFDTLFLAPLAVVQNLSAQTGINYANALVYGSFDEVSAKARALSDDEVSVKPISSVSLSEALVLEKLKALMFLIVLVVLVIASTSVNTTLSSIIFSRKKEVALHLALGAGKKDITKLFGLECLVLALVASVLGAVCGYILAQIFGYIIFNASVDFRLKAAVLAVFVSLIFAFCAAFFPIKKALKINVCENLKGE